VDRLYANLARGCKRIAEHQGAGFSDDGFDGRSPAGALARSRASSQAGTICQVLAIACRGANEEREPDAAATMNTQQTPGSRGTTLADGQRKLITAQFLRDTNEWVPNPLVNRGLCCFPQFMNLKASRKIVPLAVG